MIERMLGVGSTVRASDALWGEIKQILLDGDGYTSEIIIELQTGILVKVPIENLPKQCLDS